MLKITYFDIIYDFSQEVLIHFVSNENSILLLKPTFFIYLFKTSAPYKIDVRVNQGI